ncbi:MAG: alkaline phosphatase family protein [Eubacteriaceae bacterium]|nr:alkaline phosphatase family protein [Eubacteriaceae bacterium]
MGFEYIDYDNCIVNLACSIMRYCGIEYTHKTMPEVDKVIDEGNYASVALLLFDGMGYDLMKELLPEDAFLIRNLRSPIYSVFPTTTATATTSLQTGLYPAEHRWLGWNLWFDEIGKTVTILLNKEKDTDKDAADFHVAETFIPAESLFNRCPSGVKGITISPFHSGAIRYPDGDLAAYFDTVERICEKPGKKAVYAYCTEPDGTMHLTGAKSGETAGFFRMINDGVEKLTKKFPDTLFIVTADHGHRDVRYVILEEEHPQICSLLRRDISIEGRACTFWIRDGCLEEFDRLFEESFGDDFILMSHADVVENRIFGPSENKDYERFVGDRLAIGFGDRYLVLRKGTNESVSQHSGITRAETLVPLILLGRR